MHNKYLLLVGFMVTVNVSALAGEGESCAMDYHGVGNYYVCKAKPSDDDVSTGTQQYNTGSVWCNVSQCKQYGAILEGGMYTHFASATASDCSDKSYRIDAKDSDGKYIINASTFTEATYTPVLAADPYVSKHKDMCFIANGYNSDWVVATQLL